MIKTNRKETEQKLAADVEELATMLGCGKAAARQIGQESGARFKIGRRTLYRVSAVESYIEKLSSADV